MHIVAILGSGMANVIIAVAGMEGALPSLVTGLVSCPVIAVPTSVGYGASFGGLAALSNDEEMLTQLFRYRFSGAGGRLRPLPKR